MLRFLLLRPIAVIMVLIACLAISVLSFFQLPVSLLPAIDVPEITISVQHPNAINLRHVFVQLKLIEKIL